MKSKNRDERLQKFENVESDGGARCRRCDCPMFSCHRSCWYSSLHAIQEEVEVVTLLVLLWMSRVDVSALAVLAVLLFFASASVTDDGAVFALP